MGFFKIPSHLEGMGDCGDRDGFWLANFFLARFFSKNVMGFLKIPSGFQWPIFFGKKNPSQISRPNLFGKKNTSQISQPFFWARTCHKFPRHFLGLDKFITIFPAILLDIIVVVGPQSFGDMIFKKTAR